jgi:hypothetical protein
MTARENKPMQGKTPVLRSVRADDASYFRNRALHEQVAAQKATCEAARKSHDALALMYRFRAAMLSAGPASADPVSATDLEAVG